VEMAGGGGGGGGQRGRGIELTGASIDTSIERRMKRAEISRRYVREAKRARRLAHARDSRPSRGSVIGRRFYFRLITAGPPAGRINDGPFQAPDGWKLARGASTISLIYEIARARARVKDSAFAYATLKRLTDATRYGLISLVLNKSIHYGGNRGRRCSRISRAPCRPSRRA